MLLLLVCSAAIVVALRDIDIDQTTATVIHHYILQWLLESLLPRLELCLLNRASRDVSICRPLEHLLHLVSISLLHERLNRVQLARTPGRNSHIRQTHDLLIALIVLERRSLTSAKMIAVVHLVTASSATILILLGMVEFLLARERLSSLLHLRRISMMIRLLRSITIGVHLNLLPKNV